MSCTSQFQWTSAARTDVGRVRQRNEDSCLDLPDRGLWAVADGMGGHSVGDYASQEVIKALSVLPLPATFSGLLDDARLALQQVNRELLDEAARRHVRRIGSTVVMMLACERLCGCLWAGDSRLYLYRDGHLTQLTRDHSQVEQLKERGLITAEEAQHHPAHNMITRAVGATQGLSLDQTLVEVSDGDVFLLCSDGLSNEVTDADIAAILARETDSTACANALVEAALRNGGHDNVTAVVARAEDPYLTDKTLVNPDF